MTDAEKIRFTSSSLKSNFRGDQESKHSTRVLDVFDAQILCKQCKHEMQPITVHREGFELRAVQCPECKDKIIHPADVTALDHFNSLRGKTFMVKLRMVGNSHAISIPKEIVDFINEQHRQSRRQMADMVRLCFEDFGRLSVRFNDETA